MSLKTLCGHFTLGLSLLLGAACVQAAEYPKPQDGTWIVKDFRFHTGEVLPELKLHYVTVGEPTGEPVLVLHGSSSSSQTMLPASCSVRDSRSMPPNISSSFRTRSGRANRPGPRMDCACAFRNTAMRTWCAPSTGCSPSIWVFAISSW